MSAGSNRPNSFVKSVIRCLVSSGYLLAGVYEAQVSPVRLSAERLRTSFEPLRARDYQFSDIVQSGWLYAAPGFHVVLRLVSDLLSRVADIPEPPLIVGNTIVDAESHLIGRFDGALVEVLEVPRR